MSDGSRAHELIRQLELQPHPEGGHYAEVQRSASKVDPLDGRGHRPALTSIYYLLVDPGCSRWHQVRSDEVWLHLEGAPVDLHLLDWPARSTRQWRLAAPAAGARPQCTVPAGTWQAARLLGPHALMACVVAPGFEFQDFRLLEADGDIAGWLRAAHPALATLI